MCPPTFESSPPPANTNPSRPLRISGQVSGQPGDAAVFINAVQPPTNSYDATHRIVQLAKSPAAEYNIKSTLRNGWEVKISFTTFSDGHVGSVNWYKRINPSSSWSPWYPG